MLKTTEIREKSMPQFVVLALAGADAKGIANELSKFVTERGGNIVSSHVHVYGEVANVVILVRAIDSAAAERLSKDRSQFEAKTGLSLHVTPTTKRPPAAGSVVLGFGGIGPDFEGLLAQLTEIIAKQGLNIIDHYGMDTRMPGGMAGYHFRFWILCPPGTDRPRFKQEFQDFCDKKKIMPFGYSETDPAEPHIGFG